MSIIIGNYYEVTDNSYCVSLDTLKSTYLVQCKTGVYSPSSIEDGAEFKIISTVFKCCIDFLGETHIYDFVIVKSTKTNICYRVLYNKRNVYRIGKEYIFR